MKRVSLLVAFFRSLLSRDAGVCTFCRPWLLRLAFSLYHADSAAVLLGLWSCRFGSTGLRRGVGAAKREVLGLVGLDSVEEGRVVGGLAGGDLAVEKIDVA